MSAIIYRLLWIGGGLNNLNVGRVYALLIFRDWVYGATSPFENKICSGEIIVFRLDAFRNSCNMTHEVQGIIPTFKMYPCDPPMNPGTKNYNYRRKSGHKKPKI
ncbi:MAG: hypothetical protein WC626_02620 [Methanoregula sp.]